MRRLAAVLALVLATAAAGPAGAIVPDAPPARTAAEEAELDRLAVLVWRARAEGEARRFLLEAHDAYALVTLLEELRPKPAAAPRPNTASSTAAAPASAGTPTPSSGRCGGDLPPCSVMQCESGGNLTSTNPRSTASGKWQFLDSTWNSYGGYARARDAPEEVQDAKAREVWAGGAGARAWQQCL